MRRSKKALLFGLAVIFMVALTPAQSAIAYNGQGASDYAEYWWNKRNSNYPSYSQDCTNFVSQALHSGGGFSYVNKGADFQDDHNWWGFWDNVLGFKMSNSFIRVQDLYNFLIWHNPGGYPEGTAHTFEEQVWTYTPDAVIGGDVLFYDFGSGLAEGHTTLQVTTIGWEEAMPDRQGPPMYGNLIDEHTTDRHHIFWSLFTYNSRWASTTIYFMHISASNA
jgi:hypothetical protein